MDRIAESVVITAIAFSEVSCKSKHMSDLDAFINKECEIISVCPGATLAKIELAFWNSRYAQLGMTKYFCTGVDFTP